MSVIEPIYNKSDDVTKVFSDIGQKFDSNLESALKIVSDVLRRIELKARACAECGRVLQGDASITHTQIEIISIFDELFADLVCSIYLAGCALDKPAQMLLRRVLELGVAVVYLWDLPHIYWGWKQHDKDLNFNEMLSHLNSQSYKTMVTLENTANAQGDIIDTSLYTITGNYLAIIQFFI